MRHIPNTFKNDEVTLKRGLVGSDDLFVWLKGVREGVADPRSVTITMLDEARNPVLTFKLVKAQIKMSTGPTLPAKGGGEAVNAFIAQLELLLGRKLSDTRQQRWAFTKGPSVTTCRLVP